MNADDVLADQFEAHRGHLRALAYRMLGSVDEADMQPRRAGSG
jgi:RNA polymerase sigma-70 factor (ECF subfamily)